MSEVRYGVQFRIFSNFPWEECPVYWPDFEPAEDLALHYLWTGEWDVARVIKQTGQLPDRVTEYIAIERKCPRWLPRKMG